MTEQQIPLPFRKPARLSAAQRKAMIQTKLQDYPVYQAAREAKRKHHVIEQFKNEQLSLWGGGRANSRCSGGLVGKLMQISGPAGAAVPDQLRNRVLG